MSTKLLISTRKGLIEASKENGTWKMNSAHFDGIPVTIAYEDPRNGVWWAGLDHGHWGIKLHMSEDKGKSWQEIAAPTYPEGTFMKENEPAVNKYIWSIHHGGKANPERILIGTIPGGLFESNDYGKTWNLNMGLWEHESRPKNWFGGGFDYPGIHSIILDPRNENHIQIGVSCAGVFESTDNGISWTGKNKGLLAEFLPDPESEYGHDPHILVRSKSNPDVLWQQNHCGIFMSQNNGEVWKMVSKKGDIAHFGFTIAVAEDDPLQAWVAPAIADEKRIAVDRSLCICRTDDGGLTWKELRNGLPQNFSYDLVYRQAMDVRGDEVVFGTTTGNLYASGNRGDEWKAISNNLPMIHALTFIGKA